MNSHLLAAVATLGRPGPRLRGDLGVALFYFFNSYSRHGIPGEDSSQGHGFSAPDGLQLYKGQVLHLVPLLPDL